MKRIVILCDGTWNRAEASAPTNVVRLAQALRSEDVAGIAQVPLYVAGVGAGEGVTPLARRADVILGGGLGLGLLENIAEAYRHLVFLWEPGDEVYIFGFSRGAFTARSLTGLLRATGILDRARLDRLPEALGRYRHKGDSRTHPRHEESYAYRATLPSRAVTSADEAVWRAREGLPALPRLRVRYLGVWDTVGALGVPRGVALASLINRGRYEFHDTALSSMVEGARHALALDERRRLYEPARWANLALLNAAAGGICYEERFFAGDHGAVGGGGEIRDLSSIALGWIADGAAARGLAFDPGLRDALRAEERPMGPISARRVKRRGLFPWLLTLGARDREGPQSEEELHESARRRWSEAAPPYRPGSLRRLRDLLR